MLIKKDLLAAADEQYRPMLKEVSIPDFTKCIAQFSGLHISKVSDEVVKTYFLTWAKNKYRFYQLLGNKLKVDNKIAAAGLPFLLSRSQARLIDCRNFN